MVERGAAMTLERHCGGEKAPKSRSDPRSMVNIGKGAAA